MKKILIIPVLMLTVLSLHAQSVDTSLNNRLDAYLQLNRQGRFDELMDYVHPRLYQLAPRQQMLEVFKKTFDNDFMRLGIDSIVVVKISDEFRNDSKAYRKVEYWMGFTVVFKDSATVNDPAFVSKTTELLKVGFPNSQIRYNQKDHSFKLGTSNFLIAIRDSVKLPWLFLGYTKNEVFIKQLFTPPVIEHFKLL